MESHDELLFQNLQKELKRLHFEMDRIIKGPWTPETESKHLSYKILYDQTFSRLMEVGKRLY